MYIFKKNAKRIHLKVKKKQKNPSIIYKNDVL